jgi:hypothetical protein
MSKECAPVCPNVPRARCLRPCPGAPSLEGHGHGHAFETRESLGVCPKHRGTGGLLDTRRKR